MTEPLSSWPPPPDITPPLAAHDEFLAACVRNSTLRPSVSRLHLVRDLHQETGKDFRHCLAVVNDFCDRHTILMPVTGFKMWLVLIFYGLSLVSLIAMKSVSYMFEKSINAAVTHTEKTALRGERVQWDFVFVVALLVSTVSLLVALWYRQKKVRADAAEAVAKFGGAG